MKVTVRPYLVTKESERNYRVIVRTTRFNSQGYPLVSSVMLEDSFPTATSARSHLREHFGAEATQIATQ